MENKNEKQLIFFKDLLFVALYQWKKILIVGVVLALLLGGFAVLSSGSTVSLAGSSMSPETVHRVEQLKANQERLEGQIEGYTTYLENNLLMTINPYACFKAGVYLYVEPTGGDEIGRYEATDVILRSYRTYFLGTEATEQLSTKFNMNPLYFRSLVTYDSSYENCLGILFWAGDEETAVAYVEALSALFNDYSETNQAISHTLTLVPHLAGPVADVSVLDSQNSAIQRLTNMKNELTSVETELNRYEPTELTAGSSNPVLFAIIGAFLGACLVAALAWVAHICGGKVYSARVLQNRTGIWVLGSVMGQRKRIGIDRWLRKLEGRAQHTAPDSVAVNIRNLCKDGKKLLIMGNFCADAMSDLIKKLEAGGISCVVCPDPSVKADALEALPECDKVVLVETCGESRYEAVEWALKTVKDHEKPLLGCVLIDG